MAPSNANVDMIEFAADPYELAMRTIQLLHTRDKWIRRRVDSIELLAVDRVRRRSSFDIVPLLPLPGPKAESDSRRAADVQLGTSISATVHRGLVPFPLMVLHKETLQSLDARDGNGAPVCVLTRRQNIVLGAVLLRSLADGAFRGHGITDPRLTAAFFEQLESLAGRPAREAGELYHYLFRSSELDVIDEVRALRSSPLLARAAAVLSDGFILQVALPAREACRQVVKLAFEEQMKVRGRSAPFEVSVDMPDINAAGSHHVELLSPSEAKVASWSIRTLSGDRSLVEQRNPARVVHAQLSDTQLSHSRPVKLEATFVVDPGAVHYPSSFLAIATVGVLGMGIYLHEMHELTPRTDGSAAVLLIVPVLAAGLIARPNDHGVVRSLTRRVRFVVALMGAVTLVAASSLVINDSLGTTLIVWWVCCVVAGILALFVGGWTVAAMWRWSKGSAT